LINRKNSSPASIGEAFVYHKLGFEMLKAGNITLWVGAFSCLICKKLKAPKKLSLALVLPKQGDGAIK
jgi:hypothetical protein